jgi:hypothetical protein
MASSIPMKESNHQRQGALIELGAGFNPILSGRKTFTTTGRYWVLAKKKLMPK